MTEDLRWQQRFENYQKALSQLNSAVTLLRKLGLSDLEKQGVIQTFKFTYELGWSLLKDYLQWQGIENIVGARDAIRESFKSGLISEGHAWMEMLQDRNRSVHTYNEKTANAILENIDRKYLAGFKSLKQVFDRFDEQNRQ